MCVVFIHSFHRYLLNTYYVPRNCSRPHSVNETEKIPSLSWSLHPDGCDRQQIAQDKTYEKVLPVRDWEGEGDPELGFK